MKLLRALQERKVKAVGANEEIEVDVRVIAATHRDLEGMVEAGRFRQDLLYRLNTVTLRIPPLRERVDEIRPLAEPAPLRQIRTVCAQFSFFERLCTLKRFRSGNVVSTLLGISDIPMPATTQPRMA